ncbi:MAG: DNA primase [Bacteroidales bacterium]|nr:DNA primase [Bacteroidales bacterium]
MIDQLTIEKVRDTAQIVDVVSEFVSLKRRGQNYVGLCPFHSDKNPSFYVSPSKNICKCFSCGEGGDTVQFIMKHEQIGYLEAIRWLAKRYNIEIQEREMSAEEKAAQNAREGMLRLNEFAMKTFEDDLYNNQEGKNIGLSYFYERGLQDETIHRFHLGYALENKNDFALRALKEGHERSLLLDPSENNKKGVGLCCADNDIEIPFCRFHGRVIFPYFSLAGKPIAFGGRILQRVDHAFKKYVNSPESEIYHKSNVLYGIFQAKQEIAKQNKCFIVEGNVDVLSMSQAGFRNVVASAGTALTSNQIHLIKRFTNNVTLMFDGDEAGIRASLKSIDLLLLEGMKVKLLLFPDGDDPDSFCRKHTTEELTQFFASHEQDFISYKTQMMIREAGGNPDPQRYSEIAQSIVQSISLIEDPIMSSLYIRETAQTLNTSEPALQQALLAQRRTNYAAELRRMEIEQRRLEAQAEREAEAQAAVAQEEVNPAPTSETPATEAQAPAHAPVETLQQMATPAPTDGYVPRMTDIFERNILRYIVRYGGESFDVTLYNEKGEPVIQTWRVIDFIGSDLHADGIEFHHPLYAKMLQLAYDASDNPDVEFNSIRFFTGYPDPVISRLALDLTTGRIITNVVNEENLSMAIPRALLELKECMMRIEIADLNAQLRNRPDNYAEIFQRLMECNEIKKQLDKDLGERIITG